MIDPFAPVIVTTPETIDKKILRGMAETKPVLNVDVKDLTEKDIFYNEIDRAGNVGKYKMESGVPVKVADLGNIKEYFNHAIMKAAIMSPEEIEATDFGDLTHIEIAAVKLAAYAAAGDLKATQELLDRVLGKAKQVSESTNLNLTIDDILRGVEVKGEAEVIPDG